MSEAVQGSRLGAKLQQRILTYYVHRWTHENRNRVPAWARPTLPPISDAEWLASHAFHVTLTGELDRRYQHCEPYYP